jgi:hypothetical protein
VENRTGHLRVTFSTSLDTSDTKSPFHRPAPAGTGGRVQIVLSDMTGVAMVRALHGTRRVRRRLRGGTAFAVRVAEITGEAEGLRHLAGGQAPISQRTGGRVFRVGRPGPDELAGLQQAAGDAERRVTDLLAFLQRVLDAALRRAESSAALLAAAVHLLPVLGGTADEFDCTTSGHGSENPPGQLLTSAPAVPHGPPRLLGSSHWKALAA